MSLTSGRNSYSLFAHFQSEMFLIWFIAIFSLSCLFLFPQNRERLIQLLKDDLEKSREKMRELELSQQRADVIREQDRLQTYVVKILSSLHSQMNEWVFNIFK